MRLHPLDRLEAVLRHPDQLRAWTVDQSDIEDLPTAGEFMSLRWIWWQRHRTDLLNEIPGLGSLPIIRRFQELARDFEVLMPSTQGRSLSKPRTLGHSGVYELPPPGSAQWEPGGSFVSFQETFRAALRGEGVDQHYSDALTGAVAEMASNAVEHADSPVPPIASFEVANRAWSFGVTDVGRGALASIQENPLYADLEGEVEALELILQEGVSRTGKPGRGKGFTEVFKALVDRRAILRFRSGGATSLWEGESPTAQTIHFQGLPFRRQGFHVRVGGPIP